MHHKPHFCGNAFGKWTDENGENQAKEAFTLKPSKSVRSKAKKKLTTNMNREMW